MRAGLERFPIWLLPAVTLGVLIACEETPTTPTPTPPSSCAYSIAPVEFTPCMQAPGNVDLSVSAAAGCQWTVSATAPWITVIVNSGSGTGTARFQVADNWDAPREGLVSLQGALPSQLASARVAQAGCVYWVSQDAISFGPAGGSGNFDVTQQSLPYTCGGPLQNACRWSAVADAPWIFIVSAMPVSGDGRVVFLVAPNTGAARTAIINVRDKTVRITQTGS